MVANMRRKRAQLVVVTLCRRDCSAIQLARQHESAERTTAVLLMPRLLGPGKSLGLEQSDLLPLEPTVRDLSGRAERHGLPLRAVGGHAAVWLA